MIAEQSTSNAITPQTAQTDFFYDGTNVVEEHQGATTAAEHVSAQFVRAPDGTLVLRDRYVPTTNGGNASPLIPNTATTNLNERVYALTDAFGSTTAITGIDGTVLERYVYGANGRPQALTPAWTNYQSATSKFGPDAYTSQYDWQYMYHGARYLQLFTNWYVSTGGGIGGTTSTSYFGGGLYEYGGGSAWYSSFDGRPVQPNTAAEISAGNAHDPAAMDNVRHRRWAGTGRRASHRLVRARAVGRSRSERDCQW